MYFVPKARVSSLSAVGGIHKLNIFHNAAYRTQLLDDILRFPSCGTLAEDWFTRSLHHHMPQLRFCPFTWGGALDPESANGKHGKSETQKKGRMGWLAGILQSQMKVRNETPSAESVNLKSCKSSINAESCESPMKQWNDKIVAMSDVARAKAKYAKKER